MTVANSIKAQLDDAAYVIREQMARIAELEAEVERLRSAAGAHEVLKEIYLNPDASQANRIKAATAALNVEKPRLAMTAYVGKDSTAEVVIPLAELVAKRRARQDALQGLLPDDPKFLEWIERDGNGSDGNGGNSGNGNDTAG
jgi:hypothetical protein